MRYISGSYIYMFLKNAYHRFHEYLDLNGNGVYRLFHGFEIGECVVGHGGQVDWLVFKKQG